MPAGITKAQLLEQIKKQVEAAVEKGPMYVLPLVRQSETPFRGEVENLKGAFVKEAAGLERTTSDDGRHRRELLKRGLQTLGWLVELHGDACARLEKAVVVYDGSTTTQLVYTPEQRKAAGTVADELIRFRTAVIDSTTDGSEDARGIRERSRVGTALNRNAPLEVKDEAAATLRALHGPDATETGHEAEVAREAAAGLRTAFDERGVDLEAFVPAVAKAQEAVVRELGKGMAIKKSQARAGRDHAQVEVEQLNARILVVVNGLGGVTLRDKLRDHLPKTSQGQRSTDRTSPPGSEAPAPPGPVASGTAGNGAAVPGAAPVAPEASAPGNARA